MAGVKRKIKAVCVTKGLLIQMSTEGWRSEGIYECTKGLPEGAELVGSYEHQGITNLIFYHDSFEAIDVGSNVPQVRLFYKKYHVGRLVHLARQLAEVHISDRDILGKMAQELLGIIDEYDLSIKNRPNDEEES